MQWYHENQWTLQRYQFSINENESLLEYIIVQSKSNNYKPEVAFRR